MTHVADTRSSSTKEETSTDSTSVLVGSVIFGSTVAFSGNWVLLLLIPLLLRQCNFSSDIQPRGREWILTLFGLIAVVQVSLGILLGKSDDFSSLAVVLIPVYAVLSRQIRVKAWNTFLVLTLLEIVVGVVERGVGVTSLLPVDAAAEFTSLSLYQTRVFGLSGNSSALADKILISTLFLVACWRSVSRRVRWVASTLLPIGLYVTFNRSAIGALVLFFCVFGIWHGRRRPIILAVLSSVLILGIAIGGRSDFGASVVEAFTRGGDSVFEQESKRLDYWAQASAFIAANPISGNDSFRYRVYSADLDRYVQAHDSYLQLVATHGLALSFLYGLYIALAMNATVALLFLPMAAYSLTQYYLFWNLSIGDLFLFWTLQRFGRQ